MIIFQYYMKIMKLDVVYKVIKLELEYGVI